MTPSTVLLIAAAAAPTASAPVNLPFAPPTDRPILFETTSERPAAAGIVRFHVRRWLQFTATDEGYRLDSEVIETRYEGPESMRALAEGNAPMFKGHVTRFLVDRNARLRVVDLDGEWARMMSIFEAQMAKDTSEPGSSKAMGLNQMRAFLASLDAAGRTRILAGEADPLLRFAGSALVPGVHGLSLDDAAPGELTVTIASGDGSNVSETARYRVDRKTGLVLESERKVTTQVGGEARSAVTRVRMLP